MSLPTQKIPYQAWLHWNLTNACNFNCRYCFGYNHHTGFIPQEIDIKSVLNSLDKTGLIFRIGFTGNGEPFLIPNFVELCSEIANRHYITINTNLSSIKVSELVKNTKISKKIIKIYAAIHFDELTRLNLWDLFLNNYQQLKQAGFSIELTAVAWPGYLGRIEQYLSEFSNLNAEFNFEPFLGIWADQKYPAAYSSEQLSYFNLTEKSKDKFFQTGKPCNAGFNAAIVTPLGKVYACFQENNKLGNIYTGFNFNKNLTICRHKICGCPLKEYDLSLFAKALDISGVNEF